MTLSHSQRTVLLALARNSIAAVLRGEKPVVAAVDDRLAEPAGAFVTLSEHNGSLRGCIGSIHAVLPLAEAVSTSAINAAFRDPRFPEVTEAELSTLHLEISVMGPILPVRAMDEILVGRDGLIVTRELRSGLLLPQVAVEYGWDREQFLEHTCIKAGIARDEWRDSRTRIERFSAEIFGE